MQLKADFINNKRPTPCTTCWMTEDKGLKSKRQFNNEFLDYKLDTDIAVLEASAYKSEPTIVTYQIKTSNLCNASCVTCGSGASTAWRKYEETMGILPDKYQKLSLVDINYAEAKSIVFAGGEPLFDPMVFEILDNLIEADNTNCFISLVTNGGVTLSKTNQETLSKFTDINFCISVDGTEKVFEYLRFPLKWSTLLMNLDYFRTITSNISVSYTVSNMSDLYKDETLAWFDKEELRYATNVVQQPDYFSPEVVPGHNKWPQFMERIAKQDEAKGINIKDYLPRMHKLITQGAIYVQQSI